MAIAPVAWRPRAFPQILLQTLKCPHPDGRAGRGITSVTVVTGTQWGDEGKGKVVDFLARESAVVVRYNGGANAGHTVIVEGKKFAFHMVPSGVARRGKANIIAAGTAVDPEVLVEEIRSATQQFGALNLLVSERAHVVLPFHKLMDELQEEERAAGAKIGTTRRGLGPVYQDKAGRSGLRVGDFVDPASLASHVERLARDMEPSVPASRKSEYRAEAILPRLQAAAQVLRPFVGDAEQALWDAQKKGKAILLEGAHGMMLDLDFGTYPFVTSSSCVAGGASASGLPPNAVTRSVGVVKAYTTRVGEGPFPTELADEKGGRRLREAGAEFGTTTGRPRRCGWLDLSIVRRAVRLSGLTDLAVTKLDILEGIDPLFVAVGYTLDGRKTENVPARAANYARCKPILKRVKAIPHVDWRGLAAKHKGVAALPAEARAYLRQIELFAGAPVTLVGVGPGREDVLTARRGPRRRAKH